MGETTARQENQAFERAVADAVRGASLLDRLPPWIADTLTTEQKEAIHEAWRYPEWKLHPVNVRLSIPVIKRRFYLTVVGGEEARSAERRNRERHRYPLRTVANVLFFAGAAAFFYALLLVAYAVRGALMGG
jgi:hypothetical protein